MTGQFTTRDSTRQHAVRLYVALAEREGCELVTADDRLIRALPGFPIVHVASL